MSFKSSDWDVVSSSSFWDSSSTSFKCYEHQQCSNLFLWIWEVSFLIFIILLIISFSRRDDIPIHRSYDPQTWDLTTLKCDTLIMVGDLSPFVDEAVEMNSRLNPEKTTFLKVTSSIIHFYFIFSSLTFSDRFKIDYFCVKLIGYAY